MPTGGGEERQVVPSIKARSFAVTEQGIYYIPRPKTRGDDNVHFFSFASQESATVARLSGATVPGLFVSPDGRNLLYTQADQRNSDLMLVENFR
jgi:hypothetical protein